MFQNRFRQLGRLTNAVEPVSAHERGLKRLVFSFVRVIGAGNPDRPDHFSVLVDNDGAPH